MDTQIISYRGYEIEGRRRFMGQLYGYYVNGIKYFSLTEAKQAIDDKIECQNEKIFWQNYEDFRF